MYAQHAERSVPGVQLQMWDAEPERMHVLLSTNDMFGMNLLLKTWYKQGYRRLQLDS